MAMKFLDPGYLQELGLAGASGVCAKLLREAVPDDSIQPWTEQTLASLLDVICEPDAPDLPTPREINAARTACGFIETLAPAKRLELVRLLMLLEAGPYLLGHRRRLGALDFERRKRYVQQVLVAPVPALRAGVGALRQLLMIAYWSNPATWPAIEYDIDSNPGAADHMRGRV